MNIRQTQNGKLTPKEDELEVNPDYKELGRSKITKKGLDRINKVELFINKIISKLYDERDYKIRLLSNTSTEKNISKKKLVKKNLKREVDSATG